jgi:hypothetical protein
MTPDSNCIRILRHSVTDGVETFAQVVDHVVVVVPDRLGLANEIVLLNVLFAHGNSLFRVKITFVKKSTEGHLADGADPRPETGVEPDEDNGQSRPVLGILREF